MVSQESVTESGVIAEILEELIEMEGEETFAEVLRNYYDNLWDDLHDSAGDHDYQLGVVERIQVVQQMMSELIRGAGEEDPASEIAEGPNPLDSDDLKPQSDCNVSGCAICRRNAER